MSQPIFESQDCTRCGGCGRYSWNQMHGDMCYGCRGKGYQLTKRGQAAQDFYVGLLSKRVRDIQVGDLVRDSFSGRFYRVTEIGRDTGNMEFGSRSVGFDYDANEIWGIRTTGISYAHVDPDSMMRVGHTREEKDAARAKALEFQATLTKQGKPRKV